MQSSKSEKASKEKEKRIYLCSTTKDCEVNNHLTSKVYRFFLENRHPVVKNPEDATDILITTCSSLEPCKQKSIRIIRHLKNRYGDKRIYVLGCLPEIYPNLDILKGTRTLGPKELNGLSEYFKAEVDFEDIEIKHINRGLMAEKDDVEEKFTILTCQGCVGSCSYCAIKKAKGYVTSENKEKIKEIFQEICSKNKNPWIVLLGEDFGSYGMDIGTNCIELLEDLVEHRGCRIEIQNLEPDRFLLFFDGLKRIFEEGTVTRVHIPVQSGSQKVLRDMNRGYDVSKVIEKIKELRETCPQLEIQTSFIINYPIETRQDFFKTLRLIPFFDEIMVYDFNPMEGTPAAEIEDINPESEKKLRINVMKKIEKTGRYPIEVVD